MTNYTLPTPEDRTIVQGFWSDLLDDFKNSFEITTGARLNVSTLNSFSGAGSVGRSFAITIPVTLTPNDQHSIFFEKNANIAVRFVRAKGLYIEAVYGATSGTIIGIDELISTNGLMTAEFFGSIESYNGPAIGSRVLGAIDELSDSFYPDGQFVIEIRNDTTETISTFLSVGVEQVTDAGIYSVLLPTTQLEPTTEMSDYNGAS